MSSLWSTKSKTGLELRPQTQEQLAARAKTIEQGESLCEQPGISQRGEAGLNKQFKLVNSGTTIGIQFLIPPVNPFFYKHYLCIGAIEAFSQVVTDFIHPSTQVFMQFKATDIYIWATQCLEFIKFYNGFFIERT